MEVIRWLIVRANGETRLNKMRPLPKELRRDEVAFRLVVVIPPQWQQVSAQEIHITLPEPPQPTATTEGEPVVGERVEIVEEGACA